MQNLDTISLLEHITVTVVALGIKNYFASLQMTMACHRRWYDSSFLLLTAVVYRKKTNCTSEIFQVSSLHKTGTSSICISYQASSIISYFSLCHISKVHRNLLVVALCITVNIPCDLHVVLTHSCLLRLNQLHQLLG